MENYPAVNIFCELWPFGTYDPDNRILCILFSHFEWILNCDLIQTNESILQFFFYQYTFQIYIPTLYKTYKKWKI